MFFLSRLAAVFVQSIDTRCSSREWRCSWSSADRRCSNCIWLMNNFIAYIRELMVPISDQTIWRCHMSFNSNILDFHESILKMGVDTMLLKLPCYAKTLYMLLNRGVTWWRPDMETLSALAVLCEISQLDSSHEGLIMGNYPHDDVMQRKYFPRYWPFMRGIHR